MEDKEKRNKRQTIISIVMTIVMSLIAIMLLIVYFLDISESVKSIIYYSTIPFKFANIIICYTQTKNTANNEMNKWFYPLCIVTVICALIGIFLY